MRQPLVTLLSPTLSTNAVLRTVVLARLLEQDFRVQILGFDSEGELHPVLRGGLSWPVHRVYSASVLGLASRTLRKATRTIEGDVIYCVKPLLGSFGIGLYARWAAKRPLILDIDDWEVGFLPSSPSWELRHYRLRWLTATVSPSYRRMLDWLTTRADAITVSNSFLQALYGGAWIPHARDAQQFHPGEWKSNDMSEPSARKIVLFAGSPRPYKGMDVLSEAWPQVNRPGAVLRLIVDAPDSPYLDPLRSFDRDTVEIRGPVPFEDLPEAIRQADVVVVPQSNARATVGQLPAKLIDAMAMGKPIISTSVGDIPRWLDDGAGLVVPAGDPVAFAEAIRYVLDNPVAAAEMGRRARERFLRFGSIESVRPRLIDVVRRVLDGGSPGSIPTAFSRGSEMRTAFHPSGPSMLNQVAGG